MNIPNIFNGIFRYATIANIDQNLCSQWIKGMGLKDLWKTSVLAFGHIKVVQTKIWIENKEEN
jgi:hypothetical protein